MKQPRLYDDLAAWWPILSAPADYAEEAVFYRRELVAACAREPRTLLELGSGGGNNASHIKPHFDLTLVDRSPGMLAHSRLLNPECQHIVGDMRDVRLGREFDLVFIHDAIGYMLDEDDLRKAIATAFVHCAPGGAALLAPDHTRENFQPGTDHGGHDSPERSLRYLEWTWDPDPTDTRFTTDYAYLLRIGDGEAWAEHDRHEQGLFAREVWLRLLAEAGFQARIVPFDHTEVPAGSCELFVCHKPA